MRYFFAIIIPPLGILLCHRPVHFVVNLVIWLISLPMILFVGVGLIGWLICIVHALAVCRLSSVDKRLTRLVNAIHSAGTVPVAEPVQNA